MNHSNNYKQHAGNAKNWPTEASKTAYSKFIRGERLTIIEAIRARCCECEGADPEHCFKEKCPSYLYCK